MSKAIKWWYVQLPNNKEAWIHTNDPEATLAQRGITAYALTHVAGKGKKEVLSSWPPKPERSIEFAPWELELIALYKTTKASHAHIEGTGYRYGVENGILWLCAGNTTHFVSLNNI